MGLQIIRWQRIICTMWIPRKIERLLLEKARQRPVVVLTGARQTGKTSLVRRLFPKCAFVSLDLPSEAEQAERDPVAFLARHPPPLVVDEVQYAPGLFRHVKTVVDEHRSENGLFILTGSQRFPLMKAVSESLAGRAEIVELETLSWEEVSAARPKSSLMEFALRGGFPELHEKPALDAVGFFRSYVATYLERDLRQILDVASLRDYERFLRACALRSAQVLNRAELARDVGISPSTAAAWLSALQAGGQARLLEPWFSNRTKSLVKSPKLYLADSGLCAFLMGLRSAKELSASPLVGALWETAVFAEIRKRQINRTGGWDLHYWRDRTKEADFLRFRGGRFAVADAKWTEHPDRKEADVLRRVARELPAGSVDAQSVICRCRNPFPLGDDVAAIPLEALASARLAEE